MANMVAEVAKTILEILKLAPRFIVALGLAAGALLFANDQLIKRLGLSELVQKYRFALGLTLVLSVSLICVLIVLFFLNAIKRWWRKRRGEKHIIRRLHNLTEDEKQILRYYIAMNTRASSLKYDDGVVQGLVHNSIIYQSSSLGNIVEGFPYNITDLAWDHLHENLHLLEGNTNLYRTDKGRSWRDL